jgi:hypothetical protein
MMRCIQLERPDTIQQLRDDYLRTLVAPMDGMWGNLDSGEVMLLVSDDGRWVQFLS